MSRPGCQAIPPEYAGHLVGSSTAGLPIGRTPSGTYIMFEIHLKALDEKPLHSIRFFR
jgi:hypothetical protein